MYSDNIKPYDFDNKKTRESLLGLNIRNKQSGLECMVTGFNYLQPLYQGEIYALIGQKSVSAKRLMEDFELLDGRPCGEEI